jgi:hypothetical protein
MAYTYSKIATYTVGSGGVASIDFLNIPQTYTDLVIKCSLKSTLAGFAADDIVMRLNNDSSTVYVYRRITGDGATATSGSSSSATFNIAGYGTAATATANTFGNTEIYIPNYTSGNYKSSSVDSVSENNATTAYAQLAANLWSNTGPITSIKLLSANSGSIAQYSTAHLYGIKAEL